jgi:hypothetical protein
MIFVNRSGIKRLDIICTKTNELIYSDEFEKRMSKVNWLDPRYTSPGVNGAYIVKRLREDPSVIEVHAYTSVNPWTSSNGYTKDDGTMRVFLNTRKFGRSDASICATLSHEGVHKADHSDILFYHHGDNYPKIGTAPEVVADVAYEILAGRVSEQDSSVENDNTKGMICYRPWYFLKLKKVCYAA